MSTISVETTARLTICCTARSRSAEDFPTQVNTLGERRTDGLEETHFVADAARLVAGGGKCERPGERQHGVVKLKFERRFGII